MKLPVVNQLALLCIIATSGLLKNIRKKKLKATARFKPMPNIDIYQVSCFNKCPKNNWYKNKITGTNRNDKVKNKFKSIIPLTPLHHQH